MFACTSGPFRSSLRLLTAGDSTFAVSCASIVIVDVAFFPTQLPLPFFSPLHRTFLFCFPFHASERG